MAVNDDGKEQKFERNQYLSFLDLQHHPAWVIAWKAQDKTACDKVLMSMGVDLKFGYDVADCLHRSRIDQKVGSGPRVTFRERTDKYWLNNGMQMEDMVRETPSIISRVGMILAMNADTRVESMVTAAEAGEA